ncbi:E3 ubiquitin-protein ligase TRIM33-like [Saccostrea echinata]|uniref:E3 ubiquitin-protein ligase TRIM33-like n=1 Tax=Saccostrea echinata TaxID=191078 RepID=UPI002A7FE8B6|nr:E3 ubiquitin-protein ligase TRIM33-like [Saccostrea echinata]
MATSSEGEDFLSDLLKCSICLEIYKKPKCLPCLHSFCETCLQAYVSSSTDDKTSNTEDLKTKVDTYTISKQSEFHCPTCRNVVKIEDNSSKTTWLKNLPDNFFIVNLIDRRSIKTESKTCDPCASDGKQEPASTWCVNCTEALCKQCGDYHKKFRSFRNHSFLDLHLVKTQEKAPFTGFIPCPDHPSTQAQVFCVDHHVACCTLCATIRHRKCSDILTLEEAAKDVKNEKVTHDLKAKLEELATNIQMKISSRKERQKNLQASKEAIEQEVNTMTNEAISHLETLRASFKQELHKYQEDVSETLESEISNLSNLLSRVVYQKQLLTASVEQGSNEECLVERQHILKSEGEIKNDSSVFPVKISTGKLSFRADSEFLNLKSKIRTLGHYVEPKKYCMKKGKIELLHKNDLCVGVCNAVFDNQGNIFITDYGRERVFECDITLNCKSTVSVPGKPRDITIDKAGHIFVSLPMEKEVIAVNTKKSTVQKIFSTSIVCWALYWMNDTFFISNGDIIQIYSDVGKKRDEIETSTTWMISGKQDSESILYSKDDKLMETSVCSKEEKILSSGSGCGLRGVSNDLEGNIYTIGINNNKLYQFSSDGYLIREVNMGEFHLKGDPWSVRLSDGNMFVITTTRGSVALFEITSDE